MPSSVDLRSWCWRSCSRSATVLTAVSSSRSFESPAVVAKHCAVAGRVRNAAAPWTARAERSDRRSRAATNRSVTDVSNTTT